MESDDGGSQGPIHNFIVEPPQRVGRKTGDARRADGTRGPSAVLVVHGVGQQTKFETLDSLVRGLVRAILPAPLDHPRARLVQLAGERLNRVELRFKREGRESRGGAVGGRPAPRSCGAPRRRVRWLRSRRRPAPRGGKQR